MAAVKPPGGAVEDPPVSKRPDLRAEPADAPTTPIVLPKPPPIGPASTPRMPAVMPPPKDTPRAPEVTFKPAPVSGAASMMPRPTVRLSPDELDKLDEPAPESRKGTLRPPDMVPTSEEELAKAFEGFDEGSIAFAFDALVSEEGASKPGTGDFDLAPVRELFAELAANHVRHVRDFMIDVKWGQVTRDWIDICVPPVRTLCRAAERLELPELAIGLEKLANELDAANAIGGQLLDESEKKRLLEAYDVLVKILPNAFGLDGYKSQREAVIVRALLLQVPDVRKVTIDKLHAAGLTSLTVLFDAYAKEIATVAGIPEALAERIVARVQAYRAELLASSPQDARAAEREKLAILIDQLEQHHEAYEKAANAWGPEAKATKRVEFFAREETWLGISVLLARFGEVERLQAMEKLTFAERVGELGKYLEQARNTYQNPEG